MLPGGGYKDFSLALLAGEGDNKFMTNVKSFRNYVM